LPALIIIFLFSSESPHNSGHSYENSKSLIPIQYACQNNAEIKTPLPKQTPESKRYQYHGFLI